MSSLKELSALAILAERLCPNQFSGPDRDHPTVSMDPEINHDLITLDSGELYNPHTGEVKETLE